MIRGLILSSLLFSLLIFSIMHWLKPQPIAKQHFEMADIILMDVTDDNFDDTGKLTTRIQTQYLEHDPIEKRDNFYRPLITHFRDGAPPWVMHAEMGHTDAKRQHFYFQRDVHISQAAHANKPSTTIKTDFLEYDVTTDVAQTKRPVTMKQDFLTVKSVGALVNLKQDTIKLLSKTEGYYG